MSITERIAASFGRLWSLLSKKEKIMSDQTVIENSAATASPDASALSPLESFANEVAVPAASSVPAAKASSAAVSSAAWPEATPPAVSSAPAPDVSTPADSNAPALDTSTSAANAGSEAQAAPAPAAADATDLTQQLATPDPLANGSASAGPSSASTVGDLAGQPVVGVSTDAVSQDINASVKDFTQAFNFVESGVEKLGVAAKDELIALARKYL